MHLPAMSYTGKVENGVIVLPPGSNLPEGTSVEVVPLDDLRDAPDFVKAALRLARPRHWPTDFALNHAHYTKGEPRK